MLALFGVQLVRAGKPWYRSVVVSWELVRLMLFALNLITVVGVAVFQWHAGAVLVATGVSLLVIALAPPLEGWITAISLMALWVVVPNSRLPELSQWRLYAAMLFVRWVVEWVRCGRPKLVLFRWERFFLLFALAATAITLLFGRFHTEGFRQIIFLLSCAIFPFVLSNSVRHGDELRRAVRALVFATASILALGFVQLVVSFAMNLDTFWVYWASFVSKVYYGQMFSSVALYSNSWFNFTGGRSLRMFSIMPDSQSFAYIAAACLCLTVTLTHGATKKVVRWLWTMIRTITLAVFLSGTRAVWVGLLAPGGAVAWLVYRKFWPEYTRKFLLVIILTGLLFLASPFVNRGLAFLRLSGAFEENFIDRAKSIYDLRESSNAGRIQIWHESSGYFFHHPFGVGVSNFIVSLGSEKGSYEELASSINTRYNLPNRYISAHSLYLQLLVETGVIGFSLFLSAFGSYFVAVWEYLKKRGNGVTFRGLLVFQVSLLLLWFAFAGLFDVTLFNDKVLIVVLSAISMSGLAMRLPE